MTRDKMIAVIHTGYGPPEGLELKEIDKPSPKKNEILVKISATSVTPSDILLRSGKFPLLFWLPVRAMFGLIRPRNLILGYELSGVVEAVGDDVTKFTVGDEVFGGTYWKMSCYAEYICLSEDAALGYKPENVTLVDAAAIPDGASTAYHFLEKANIQLGDQVLIYGASGSIGTYSIQLAKYMGAEVTAVCSAKNFELVTSLGADHVIDYRNEDYGNRRQEYDVVFDTVGRSSFGQAKKALKQDGTFLTTKFKLTTLLYSMVVSLTTNKKLVTEFAISNPEKLKYIIERIEEGAVRPVIDRYYSLSQIREAHDYVGKGHKRGNVVVSILIDR